MWSQLSKLSTAALVLATIAAIVVVAVLQDVDPEPVVAGLFGLANLLLGAGAVSHGVNQGTNAAETSSSSSRK